MRSRILRTFVAAAAAGATAITLGLATTSCRECVRDQARTAAYLLSADRDDQPGRLRGERPLLPVHIRTLTVPDTSFLTGLYPQEYIQLSNGSLASGDQYVRAGIESCIVARTYGAVCTTGSWVSYVEAFNNSLNGPYFAHYSELSGVNQGDGVNFSIYFDQGGNELHFVITPPSTSGPVEYYKTRAYGPIFDHAAALDDFTNSTGVPIALPPFVQSFRINQFLQGALTTYSGSRGSFIGQWTTSAVIATSNGLLPPSGTTRVSPTPLWSDGLAANNQVRLWDAFGVWAR